VAQMRLKAVFNRPENVKEDDRPHDTKYTMEITGEIQEQTI